MAGPGFPQRPANAQTGMPQQHYGPQQQQHYIGDRDSHKTIFDDKIACMANMMYPMSAQPHMEVPIDKKLAWAETARNYFTSKAAELELLLKHVESFGDEVVTPGHIEDMGNRGFMLEHNPMKLSRDMWGYLNLNIPATSRDRASFNNATPGNGFDAWRRLVEPLGPNTLERMFELHRDVTRPKKSTSV